MKRGQTDLSLMLAVDKPRGMTSHDVVNACRRIFGEKRVGHAGTLDPAAEGVLIMLVGPATRLNAQLEAHSKSYAAHIAFGSCTDTDDAEGAIIRTAPIPPEAFDEARARAILKGFLGQQMQMPPIYSAIKKAGVKAYEAARAGKVIDLEARPITVERAELLGIGEDGGLSWDVLFEVSKGTYIRSLARDVGRAAGTEAHLSALKRLSIGSITLRDCVSLEALEAVGERAALDPVRALGLRFAYAEGPEARSLANGGKLSVRRVVLHEYVRSRAFDECACTSGVIESCRPPQDGERISVLLDNALKAVYRFDGQAGAYVPDCVFSKAVIRGVV